MEKILSITKYALILISVALLILQLVTGGDTWGLDVNLLWTAFLLIAAILLTVGLSAINIGKNPKGAKNSLIGIGAVAVIILVSYFLSSSEPLYLSDGKLESDKFALILSDMGLISAYIVFVVAFIAVVGGEIWNAVKK